MDKRAAIVFALSLCLTIPLFANGASEHAKSTNVASSSAGAVTAGSFDTVLAQEVKLATSGSSAVIKGEPVIAMSIAGLGAAGYIGAYSGVLQAALDTHGGLITLSAGYNAETEANQIQDLIQEHVAGVVLMAQSSAAVTPSVRALNAAGIPVAQVDRESTGGKSVAYYTANNIALGAAAASEIEKMAGPNVQLRILDLQGDLGITAGKYREKGFIDEVAKYPNMKIVSTIPTFFDATKAANGTLDALQAHPDINFIFMSTDTFIPGVESVLRQLGRLKKVGEAGHIYEASVDGQPAGLNAVREGYLDVCISQDLPGMGYKAYKALLTVIHGGTIPQDQAFQQFPPQIITSKNVNNPKWWGNRLKGF